MSDEDLTAWVNDAKALAARIKDRDPELVGELTEPDLLAETEDLDLLATVDHIIPLSKGGAQYDEDNCCVACFPCNNNRKADDMWDFRMRRKP